MKMASLGRSARSKAGIKVRQPLDALWVITSNSLEHQELESLSGQLLEELNVKNVKVIHEGDIAELNFWHWQVAPDMSKIGPKYGSRSRRIAEELNQRDAKGVVEEIRVGYNILLPTVSLSPDEISVTRLNPAGLSVVEAGDYVVAVSTELTSELVEEGLARELVHRLQNMRRSAGFDIADYIITYYSGGAALAEVMDRFAAYITQETLSGELVQGGPPAEAYTERQNVDGIDVILGVLRKA
jgi:isoleucyl-tRNA synthetase